MQRQYVDTFRLHRFSDSVAPQAIQWAPQAPQAPQDQFLLYVSIYLLAHSPSPLLFFIPTTYTPSSYEDCVPRHPHHPHRRWRTPAPCGHLRTHTHGSNSPQTDSRGVYVCIRMYTYVYVCIRMYTYVYVCIRIPRMHICMRVYVCMYAMNRCMHLCIYVYACVFMYDVDL